MIKKLSLDNVVSDPVLKLIEMFHRTEQINQCDDLGSQVSHNGRTHTHQTKIYIYTFTLAHIDMHRHTLCII